jgi:hypothetical protein
LLVLRRLLQVCIASVFPAQAEQLCAVAVVEVPTSAPARAGFNAAAEVVLALISLLSLAFLFPTPPDVGVGVGISIGGVAGAGAGVGAGAGAGRTAGADAVLDCFPALLLALLTLTFLAPPPAADVLLLSPSDRCRADAPPVYLDGFPELLLVMLGWVFLFFAAAAFSAIRSRFAFSNRFACLTSL